MVFERIEAVEYPVVEMFFPEFVPEVFLRIKFGRVWRQEQQSQIVRQAKPLSFVPVGAIEHHDHVVVRIAADDLVEEYLHAVRIDRKRPTAPP